MDKKILSDYIDACELIRETEQQIRRLEHDVYEIGDIGKRWNKRNEQGICCRFRWDAV